MLLIFWFQTLCGWSGSNQIEQLFAILFSITITGFPPLVNAVFDKDIDEQTLMEKPHLYKQGLNNEVGSSSGLLSVFLCRY